MRFVALDGRRFGYYQRSRRIGRADCRSNEWAVFLVHVGLGGPTYFLAEIHDCFAECDVAISIRVGFATQGPQQIVGEEAMPVLAIF